MHHNNWRAKTTNAASMLDLAKEDDAELCRIATLVGIEPNDLIRVAIIDRIRVWSGEPDAKGVKDAMMLEKLYRR